MEDGRVFRVVDLEECSEDGEEADAVEEEVAGDAEGGHGISAEGGTEDAGEVELGGVEGDGVGEVFTGYEAGNEGLVAGGVHGLCYAVEEGDEGDFPDVYEGVAVGAFEPGEQGESEGEQHHGGLGHEQ